MAALLVATGRIEQATATAVGQLTGLGLSHGGCQIGDDGAEIIAAFLETNTSVTHAHLAHCNIGPRGVRAIAEVLKHNKSLWHLNLSDNKIGVEAIQLLIAALDRNVCIRHLWVSGSAPAPLATLKYLTEVRNAKLIPAAVRKAALCLISARQSLCRDSMGVLAIFPKELVKLIAMQVWATRCDPKWIEAIK